MKCFVVLCFALAVANGQLMGSLYDWVGSTGNLMSAGVDVGTGAVKGLAGMKQGAVNSAMNVGRGAVNVGEDFAGTMVGANIGAAQGLIDRYAPSVIASPMSGLLGMVNKVEQAKISGISAAARMPMNMIDSIVGLEVGAMSRIADAVNSFMQLNIKVGAGAAQSMIQLMQGISSMSGQMGRIMPILMREMPGKLMQLAVEMRKLDLVPAMKNIFDDLNKAAHEIYNNVKDKFDEALSKLTGPEAQKRLAELRSALQDMVQGTAGAIDKMISIAQEMGLPESQVGHLRTLLENMSSAFAEVKELREAVEKGMEHLHQVMDHINSTVSSEEFQELRNEMEDFLPKLMHGSAGTDDIDGFVQKVVTAMPDMAKYQDEMVSSLKSYENATQLVREHAQEALEKLQEVFDKIQKFVNLPAVGKAIKQLSDNIKEVINRFRDGTLGNVSGMAGNAAGLAGNMAGMGLNAAGMGLNAAGMGLNAAGMGLNAAGAATGAAGKAVSGASSFLGGRVWG